MPPPSDRGCCRALSLSIAMLLMLQVERSCSATTCVSMDMAVVVDTSSSCTDAEFKKLQSEVKALASNLSIGEGKTRLALISMSQSAQVLANFNDVKSLSDFDSAVDRLSLTSGHTEISNGMKVARESVLNTARNAPIPRLLVLVKDRQCDKVEQSTDAELALIKSEADAVRSMGGTVHAVGVGGLWNSHELNALFGQKYLLFVNKNKAMESIKSLNSELCTPTNCKHNGQSVKPGTCFGAARHVLTVNVVGALNSAGGGVCRQEIARSFQSCTEKQSCNKMERTLGTCQANGNLAIVETMQFFNRKTQSCVADEDKKEVDCTRATECQSQVADVIILLDRSGSLRDQYSTLVDAATEIIKSLQIGEKNVHVGVISFSGYQEEKNIIKEPIETTVHLGEEFDRAKILIKVQAMKINPAFFYTYTGEALKRVHGILKSKSRSTVSKSIIIITDGKSNDGNTLFNAASDLKKDGVTIYAIGISNNPGALNMDELRMLAAPEIDRNLFILENFDALKSWAVNFSMRLCMELKPPNPKLCDADVQFKSISACVQSKMQTTVVSFKFDIARKCMKHFTNTIVDKCKGICVDPIDGSDHLEGESWVNMCHEIRCNTAGSPTLPTKATKCVAADYSCKAIGSAPFQCRNLDGELRENCQCVDKSGEAVLVVDNPN